MRAVNLLPRDDGRRGGRSVKAPKPVVLVAGLGASLVVAALAAALVITGGAVSDKRAELERRQVELTVTPRPPKAQSAERIALAGQQSPRVAAVSTALAGRIAWDRILRRFSLVLPGDVWLKNLSVKAPTFGAAVAGSPPQSFSISGYSYSHDGVARLLSRLSVLPDLTNLQLQTSNLSKLGQQKVVEFSILADVRTEVPAS